MKLQSFDNKRVLDAVIQLIKLCKDLTYQGHIRELYDILMKWTFIRLWGGNPALLNIIELLPPMISILEKRKLPLNDLEIDLVLAVIR